MDRIGVDRSESNAIKGLLIILIILGHVGPLLRYSMEFNRFLYDFHVYGFFILPLFYPHKQLCRERIMNYFARLMVPYIVLFWLFWLGIMFINAVKSLETIDVAHQITVGLKAMILGGHYPLLDSIKLRYLWFLPQFFSFSIIKDYFYTAAKSTVKAVLMIMGFLFYVVLWVSLYTPFFSGIKESIMYWSPISVWQAIGVLFIGVVTITIIKELKSRINNKSARVFILALFVGSYLLYYIIPEESVYLLLLKSIVPIIGFSLIYSYRGLLAQSKLLRRFGEHSFEVYIVQTPICIAMYMLLPKILPTDFWGIKLISFVLLLAICYYTATMSLKLRYVKRFLFPRTWDELLRRT